jgi:hypothetical protein
LVHSPMKAYLARRSPCAVAILVFLALAGCGAGWHRPPSLEPGPLPLRQQVQVWEGAQVDRWHAVIVTADSISGIPYLSPLHCASCRTTRSRLAVDSVRLGNPVAGFWKTAGLVVATPIVLAAVLCAVGGRTYCWPTGD